MVRQKRYNTWSMYVGVLIASPIETHICRIHSVVAGSLLVVFRSMIDHIPEALGLSML